MDCGWDEPNDLVSAAEGKQVIAPIPGRCRRRAHENVYLAWLGYVSGDDGGADGGADGGGRRWKLSDDLFHGYAGRTAL